MEAFQPAHGSCQSYRKHMSVFSMDLNPGISEILDRSDTQQQPESCNVQSLCQWVKFKLLCISAEVFTAGLHLRSDFRLTLPAASLFKMKLTTMSFSIYNNIFCNNILISQTLLISWKSVKEWIKKPLMYSFADARATCNDFAVVVDV